VNLSVVAVLTLVLAVPAVPGLADHSIDPDEVGLRVLLAVGAAVAAEVVLRRFVDAVRGPAEQPLRSEDPAAAGAGPRRRQDDPPAA
jgi:hypothetical protein